MVNTVPTEKYRPIVFPDPEPAGATPPRLGVVFSTDNDPFYFRTGSGTQQVEAGDALALKFADHRPGQIAALLPGLHTHGMLDTVEIESGELTTADLEALSGAPEPSGAISSLRLVLGKQRMGRHDPPITVRLADRIDWSVLTSVERLVLHGVAVTDDHLARFGAPSSLRMLEVDTANFSSTSLRRFDGLFGLLLGGVPLLASDLSFLEHHNTLNGFGMRFSDLTNDQLIHISRLPRLRVVDIGYNGKLGPDLSGLAGATNLELLELSGTAVDGTSIAMLRSATKLTHLELESTHLTDTDVSLLRYLPRITNLNVAGTRITDVGLATIVESLPNLRYLDIRDTGVTTDGLSHLTGLKQLVTLGLTGEILTMEVAERLATETTLREVHTCPPYVSDDLAEIAEPMDFFSGWQTVGRPH